MKKGIIASVNDTNKNVARLITGEIVLGTKDQPMKEGSIVTYTTKCFKNILHECGCV